MLLKRQEADYLRRLQDDLRRSKNEAVQAVEFAKEGLADASFVLETVTSCTLPERSRDRFATGVFRLGKLTQSSTIDTTFEEMQTTGILNTLSDRSLVEALLELRRREAANALAFRQIQAWTSDQVKEVHSRVVFRIAPNTGGWGPITWEQLTIDFDVLCEDQTYVAAIGALRNYSIENLARAERGLERLNDTLLSVEATLEKTASTIEPKK
ncbi:MAG: hypothetical protein AAF668_02725 [Pseudomonadota bacterium]